MNKFFKEDSIKSLFKKNKIYLAFSFSIGVLISAIPYIYQFIEDLKIEKIIQQERQMLIKEKEKRCKNKESDYRKFINLGFPKTAIIKFKICMKEK